MIYSKHAIERLKERFPYEFDGRQSDRDTFHRIFEQATLDGRFLNNTRFMVYLMEKYGDCDRQFYTYNNAVFVVKHNKVVVTVVDHHYLETVYNINRK